MDVQEVVADSVEEVTNEREEALAKQLKANRRKKKRLVDQLNSQCISEDEPKGLFHCLAKN